MPQPDDFDTLIMMGGPMSVNEDNIYSYIKEEEKLVRNFIAKGKKVFGVCLGAQIMAKALGARVYTGHKQEIGWHDIELTTEGIKNSLMQKLATHPQGGDFWKRFKVFHWHGETFDIPQGAVRLAGSELYPNQAFRCGDKAYAFQFHIEVNKDIISGWFKDNPVAEKIKEETEKFYNVCCGRAMNFYELFFRNAH
ncbi:MAG: type 1 glutamine amidotransferase [Nitrospirae bacterium]|nr:type 1 glutamine amidotransferase [Nitrospirota bacterium]